MLTAKRVKQPFDEADGQKVHNLVVKLIFLVYWLFIFEGAIRKWLFPQYQQIFFFIKEPFVLLIYLLAFKYRLWPTRSALFKYAVVLGMLSIPLIIMQAIANDLNPIIVIYGWRTYYLYIPLAFIIAEEFKGQDLARLVRQTLWFAIPAALLISVQYHSPVDAPVNQLLAQHTDWSLPRDKVRPASTFSVARGQELFVGSVIAMIFSVWLLPTGRRSISNTGRRLATPAVLVHFALNGSRTIFLEAAISCLAAMAAGLLIYKPGVRSGAVWGLVTVPLMIVILALLYVTIFSGALETAVTRHEQAERSESSAVLPRLKRQFANILPAIFESPLLGHGIGVGSGGGSYLATGRRTFTLAEDEWPRLVQEGGLFGLLFLGYRIALVVWLGVGAVLATRRSSNPVPLLFFSFAGPILLRGEITLGGPYTYYGWLFAGFTMAANRLAAGGKESIALTRQQSLPEGNSA